MEGNALNGLDHFQLCILLEFAAEMGAINALIQTGKLRPYLNRSQADRKYGRKNVERWISAGLVAILKDGDRSSPLRIDRLGLASVAMAEDFIRHYFNSIQ